MTISDENRIYFDTDTQKWLLEQPDGQIREPTSEELEEWLDYLESLNRSAGEYPGNAEEFTD